MDNDKIRIVLADDHTLLRQTLSLVFTTAGDIELLADVHDASAAIEAARTHKPDVLVLDLNMPGLRPLSAVPEIIRASPETRVLVLTAHLHDGFIEEAIKAGASGYLTKTQPLEILVDAVRKIAAGQKFYSADVRDRLGHGGERTRGSSLSPREREVRSMIAQGLSKKEIADKLDLSVKTVEKHVGAVMGKLDLHDRVDLARYAIREGIVTP